MVDSEFAWKGEVALSAGGQSIETLAIALKRRRAVGPFAQNPKLGASVQAPQHW